MTQNPAEAYTVELSIRSRAKAKSRPQRTRPSVLDLELRGDPWISRCNQPELLVLYLNNQPVTLLPGSPLDQASLNQLLFSIRNRNPRHW